MHKDVAAGAELMGSDDDRANGCVAATDVAACDRIDREQLQLVVDVESQQPLVRFLTQPRNVGLNAGSTMQDMPRTEDA